MALTARIARSLRSAILPVVGFAAAATGTSASADFCRLPWDVPCCRVCDSPVGIASVNLKIMNCTDVGAVYRWELPNQNGLIFNPNQGIVGLAPGEMTNIPITVCCPPNSPIGVPLVYSVRVTNTATGNIFFCEGSVIFTGQIKAQACDPSVPVVPGRPTRMGFVFTGMDIPGPISLPVSLEFMGDLPVKILNAPPAAQIIPGVATTFAFDVLLADNPTTDAPAQMADVLILWDQDGDGDQEVGSSIALLPQRRGCPGDINGDGVVNASDLAFLLGSWGPCQ